MGTRGVFGFFYKGCLYIVYNHFDSYPSGLGADLVHEIQQAIADDTLKDWSKLLENITIIDQDSIPTQKDIIRLRNYADLTVSLQSQKDWYCLTRRCQGSMFNVLLSGYLCPYMDTAEISSKYASEGILDDYEDYGYILNFDENTFDVFGCADEHEKNHDKRTIFPLSSLSTFFDFFEISPKKRITSQGEIPFPWEKKPLH